MSGREVRKYRSFRMCLSLYDYQSKANRYSYVLTYLKIRVTTNQKHTIDSQKPKRKELKYNTKEKHQTTEGKTKRRRNEYRRTTKSTGKQGLKWQHIPIIALKVNG